MMFQFKAENLQSRIKMKERVHDRIVYEAFVFYHHLAHLLITK
jgi:hypothetical protein